MAEIKERTLKVLQALSQMTEPTRPTEIGNAIGEKPIDVGRFLVELLKGGLAEKVDEEQNLWTVTEKGTEYLGSIEKEPLSQPPVTGFCDGFCHRNYATTAGNRVDNTLTI